MMRCHSCLVEFEEPLVKRDYEPTEAWGVNETIEYDVEVCPYCESSDIEEIGA